MLGSEIASEMNFKKLALTIVNVVVWNMLSERRKKNDFIWTTTFLDDSQLGMHHLV